MTIFSPKCHLLHTQNKLLAILKISFQGCAQIKQEFDALIMNVDYKVGNVFLLPIVLKM